jgi:hypothetical protein
MAKRPKSGQQDGGRSTRKKKTAAKPDRDKPYLQPGRSGTKPITVHLPRAVRDQLKILAVEKETTLHRLIAEAVNDLFAKHGKPRIVPSDDE